MDTETLRVDRADRRALKVPWSALLHNKAHEFWIKATGRRIKGQGMIAADSDKVRSGFTKLGGADFPEYNLPQAWVESRQIPRVLHERVPQQNARIIDLGCGPGTSTRVLSYFAHESWQIVGYDFVREFIQEAQQNASANAYQSRDGSTIQPRFVCQDIAQPLMLDGQPLPDAAYHLALSGGVVGLYLHPDQCKQLVQELRRIIIHGGYIALDAGPSIPTDQLRNLCEAAGFHWIANAKSFVIEPRPKLIFQKR